MSSFVNKLATAVTRAGRQYSVTDSNSQAESLIEVLSLQVTTQSKIRLTADNLVSFVFKNSVAEECVSVDHLIKKSTSSSSLNVCKKKSSILNLIKDVQEFDPQCRQICSQLHDCISQDFLLALTPQHMLQSYSVIKNEFLTFADRVFVPHQEAIQDQLLQIYHNCSSEGH